MERVIYTEGYDDMEGSDGSLDPENPDEGEYYEEDEEDIDYENYKGIYFGDEPGQKYQCPETGAHFEFNDMCGRLKELQEQINAAELEMHTAQETQSVRYKENESLRASQQQKHAEGSQLNQRDVKALLQNVGRADKKKTRNTGNAAPMITGATQGAKEQRLSYSQQQQQQLHSQKPIILQTSENALLMEKSPQRSKGQKTFEIDKRIIEKYMENRKMKGDRSSTGGSGV